jgi:hypothetical protein
MMSHKRVSYIRSFDRRIMVQIEPGCFVALGAARRLRLIAKRRRAKANV